jgi:hypothetical protein
MSIKKWNGSQWAIPFFISVCPNDEDYLDNATFTVKGL